MLYAYIGTFWLVRHQCYICICIYNTGVRLKSTYILNLLQKLYFPVLIFKKYIYLLCCNVFFFKCFFLLSNIFLFLGFFLNIQVLKSLPFHLCKLSRSNFSLLLYNSSSQFSFLTVFYILYS